MSMINVKNEKITEQFESMMQRVEFDDRGKFDFEANLRNIEFNDGNGRFVIPKEKGDETEFDLSPTAYNQIMGTLGIPAQYAKKLPNHMLKPHFDYWKKEVGDKNFFVRAKEIGESNRVRAFLSPRYNTLDNKDVVNAFTSSLSRDKYLITDYRINEDMFNARLIFRNMEYNNVIGPDGKFNKFFAGLHIANGETGNYSVTIDLIIWEQWCTNGAVRRFDNDPILMKKHIGNNVSLVDKFNESLKDIHLKAEQTMELFVDAKGDIIEDPTSTLTKIMNRRKEIFTEPLKATVMEAYERRPDSSRYGIISALTQSAQTLPYEKRLDLEKLAGDIMAKAITI